MYIYFKHCYLKGMLWTNDYPANTLISTLGSGLYNFIVEPQITHEDPKNVTREYSQGSTVEYSTV